MGFSQHVNNGDIMWKIALSMTATFPLGIIKSIEIAKKYNFEGLEIIVEPPNVILEALDYSLRQKIRKLSEDYDLTLFVHAPFYNVNIASLNRDIRHVSEKLLLKTIVFASDIGAKIVVVHPGLRFFPGEKFPQLVYSAFTETMFTCVEIARDLDIQIALENRANTIDIGKTPEELLKLLELIKFPKNVGIAFDTAQAQLVMNPTEFYKKIAKYVIHAHIRDSPKNADYMLPVGEGDIDFQSLLKEFAKNHYSGALVLEVGNMEYALISRERLLQIIRNLNIS